MKGGNGKSASQQAAAQLAALCYRVTRKRGTQILLITSRETGRWVIPKGWPMKGRSDAEAVARSTRGPVTRVWLRDDLAALGLKPGMLLMVHTSLSQLGWVIGGPLTVVAALRDCVGAEGTLVMPVFSMDNTDPARSRHPRAVGTSARC